MVMYGGNKHYSEKLHITSGSGSYVHLALYLVLAVSEINFIAISFNFNKQKYHIFLQDITLKATKYYRSLVSM